MNPCVTVQIVRGPAAGRRAIIEPGVPVIVGRLPDCGLAILDDPTISRRHCEIVCQGPDVVVRNLGSNGIRVNGKTVEQARLAGGDVIELGTNSALQIQLEATIETRPATRESTAKVPPAAIAANIAPIRCRRELAKSGLAVLTPVSDKPRTLDVFGVLQRPWKLSLVVRAPEPNATLAEQMAEAPGLLEWVPPESRMQLSPMILRQPEPALIPELLERSPGGAIAAFSTEEFDKVCLHLQQYAGAFITAEVLHPQLTATTPELAAALLGPLKCVLSVSEEGKWTLFSTAETAEALQPLGFECEPAEVNVNATVSTTSSTKGA